MIQSAMLRILCNIQIEPGTKLHGQIPPNHKWPSASNLNEFNLLCGLFAIFRIIYSLNDSIRLGRVPGGEKPKLPHKNDQPTLHQLLVKAAPERKRAVQNHRSKAAEVMGELSNVNTSEIVIFYPRGTLPCETKLERQEVL